MSLVYNKIKTNCVVLTLCLANVSVIPTKDEQCIQLTIRLVKNIAIRPDFR